MQAFSQTPGLRPIQTVETPAPAARRQGRQTESSQAESLRSSQLTRLGHHAHPLSGAADYQALRERIGPARFVLLGEASHGTHEFYSERARLTRQLIETGFDAVLIEGDWPDAARVNRFVRGLSGDREAIEALADFKRFPTWMWRNADVLDFVGWLRDYASRRPVGFYGLDLYSLHRSIEAVLAYLDRSDAEIAARARKWYACFDLFDEDPQSYGLTTSLGLGSCEQAVIQALKELRPLADGDGDFFEAEQNARVAKAAEAYYRAMFAGRPNTWNLRDTHMADTLDAIDRQLSRQLGRPARLAVWAHNSHIGDARATQSSQRGELNIGQLVRERHGQEVCLIGFTSFAGSVTAATDWDGAAERKALRPALPESWEELFHRIGSRFWLDCRDPGLGSILNQERLERFVGVIYRPETERWSHYFEARIGAQYDLVIHIDQTRAVEPLERTARWDRSELPETYPSAL